MKPMAPGLFLSYCMNLSLHHHVILPNALLCSYELNTLDACWLAVDVWSNSSRSRQDQSTNLGRAAYIHDHCLGYRHDYSLFYQLPNSKKIYPPYAIFSREVSSENYGPWVYFPMI